MTDLIPQFGNFAFTIVAFVAAISIIVAIHEYGHYIVGRWSGIHAEVFSLGFGPVLFSRTDRHGTKWQLAAFPFGGYVKFLGDSNAASGKDGEAISALSDEERRHTMHGAPLWARASTVAAGPIFNFILSALIFAAFFYIWGQPSENPRVGELREMPADMAVLQEGDLIRSFDGIDIETYADLFEASDEVQPAASHEYVVERGGDLVTVQAVHPRIARIGTVTPRSAAIDAGLQVGDYVRAINGEPVYSFSDITPFVEASESDSLTLTIWRDGEEMDVTLSPRFQATPTEDGQFVTRPLIGIGSSGTFFEPGTDPVSIWASVKGGVRSVGNVIEMSLNGLWHMIIGNISTCNLQGPIGIAQTSADAASQGFDQFIWLVAVLSTAVGMLNLFPIPVLDGGHLVFHAFEAVAGRPPSDKALKIFMSAGLFIVLSLMLFALTNDLFCP